MASTGYFTKDGLRFLADLRTHNEKPWFEANKERFEAGLREPGLRLVADLEPVLKKISKHFVADAKPNGGSMSRIYRDTRFSKDKSPYKTALFFHFGHARGTEDATPAFYFHIEPGGSTVGGGIWHPATPLLEKIRRAIVKSPSAWDKAKGKSGVGAACSMGGEMLKKVPRGYDPEDPNAEDLKRKDFGVHQPAADTLVTSPTLPAELGKRFAAAAPVLAFLCEAVGLPF
jgi:uncharacterized protein (TIGR02453 family)